MSGRPESQQGEVAPLATLPTLPTLPTLLTLVLTLLMVLVAADALLPVAFVDRPPDGINNCCTNSISPLSQLIPFNFNSLNSLIFFLILKIDYLDY